ncbi:hypothetical protein BDA99DRAFT_135476 [Phascolomyces articulosus]|uniref:HMG box domain-containing protein n=1 Tax=Phascolomyces articulosus TaxID=60185 RepID=A0AAD5K9G7_9FUNG|nr:hypothetical protein BDA99DRAFT_135476 [Phascolomyces articulosus]
MEHLVSPNAIREAEREENDELMGNNAEHHPFSGYPSILSMKQQDRRNSSGSHSASPPLPPTFSPDQQPYPFDEDMEEEDSPSSPSSSSVTMTSSMEDREENGGLIIPLDDSTSTTTAVYHHGYDMSPQDQGQHSQPPSGVKERLKRPPNAYLLFNRDIRRRLLEESPKMTVAEISKEIGERWKRLDPEQRQGYMRQAALIKQDHLKNHPDFIYTRRSKAQLAEARKFSRSRKGSHSQHHPNNNNGRITTDMNSTAHSTINMIHPSTSSSSISSSIPTTAGWPAATSATVTTTSTGTTTDYNNNSNNNNTTLVPHKRRRKSGMHDGPRDPRGRKKKRYRHPTAPKHPMSGFLFFLAAVRPEVARQYPGSTVGPISKVIASQWRDMTDEARIPWLQLAEEDKARYAREMRLYTATLEKAEEEEDASLSASEEQITPPDHPYAVVTTGVINMVNGHHTSSTTNIQHHHPSIHPLQQQQQQQHSHSMYDPVQLSQSIQLPSKLHTTTTTSSNSRMTNHNNNSSSSTSPTNYHYHPHHHHTHHHHHPAAGDMLYRSDSSRSLSTGYAVISGPNEYS